MNSSVGTTVASRRRPHFRHSLASGPLTDQLCTSRFGERGISTPTCWGLLKQPDNQKRCSVLAAILAELGQVSESAFSPPPTLARFARRPILPLLPRLSEPGPDDDTAQFLGR